MNDMARPADQALVSDHAPAGHGPSGFDPSRVAFNVNDKVWVRLTEGGREILRSKERELNHLYMPLSKDGHWFPQPNADGWLSMQLWEVMHAFGQHIYNGARVPFETNILLEKSSLRGALPSDSDGSPKGGDGEAGSVHDSAAIAQTTGDA